MQSWLSRLFIIVTVFTVCWLYALYYWQTSHRVPSGSDIAIYFLAIPLGVLALGWLALKAWKSRSSLPAAAAIAPSTQADTQVKTDAGAQKVAFTVLSSSTYTHQGDTAEALLDALSSGESSFELDTELVNDEGYPILSGRITETDVTLEREAMQAWCADHQIAEIEWSNDVVRALSCANKVVNTLIQDALNHPLIYSYLEANETQRLAIPLPAMLVQVLVPEQWQDIEKQFASNWLKSLIADLGWPEEKLLIELKTQQSHVQSLQLIQQLMMAHYRQAAPIFCMQLSCGSYIDEMAISALPNDTKNAEPSIPSEGASGVLMADQTTAQSFSDQLEISSLLHPMTIQFDAAQPMSVATRSQHLMQLVTETLAQQEVQATDIACLITDTDQQANKLTEIYNLASTLFPELDATTQIIPTLNACGQLRCSATLTALALAHAYTLKHQQSVIVISHMDMHTRTISLVRPPQSNAVLTQSST